MNWERRADEGKRRTKDKIEKTETSEVNSKFMTMRHIETVRNGLTEVVKELLDRAIDHDQTKLEEPEVGYYDQATPKLRGITYGSPEYKAIMKEIKPAIDHHQGNNRHHPEYFKNGVKEMNLVDLIEMIVDWKAASMRHGDGDIMKSIKMNKERFGYSDELEQIFLNTVKWLETTEFKNKAEES